MTVIFVSQLQPSDLERLGHELPAVVRADRRACRERAAVPGSMCDAAKDGAWSAVERSLACLGETLPVA